MELETLYFSLLCLFVSFVYLSLHFLFYKKQSCGISSSHILPPGRTGWPLIGESLEFLSAGRNGHPEGFILDRMAKYSRDVFRTHLIGEPTAVFCGSAGNKFLFSNEKKLVRVWWPLSTEKLLGYTRASPAEAGANVNRMLNNFIKPEALRGYIGIMDEMSERHFSEKWENEEQVVVLPLAKQYTLSLASKLFFSIEDPHRIKEFLRSLQVVVSGFLAVPINLPGTRLNKAIKACNHIRKEILSIVQQRKDDLEQGKSPQDFLSHMLSISCHENDTGSDHDIANLVISMLIAGHDTVSTTCTLVVKYLAEIPEICEAVRSEQVEITKSKAPGELLNWEDLQKMKYSWNVVCEVLRLAPPAPGNFREAIDDFTYKGFTIPKGMKLYWSVHSTHMNPEFFPEPDKFDPSRFEGFGPAPYTFVPFGGGPRMCPGQEYARLKLLVFIHHLVKRFKWDKIIPDEQIVMDPMPIPTKGLPIRLFPHKA